MQARTIILADHSGTAQGWNSFPEILHIWPLWRNILCHLLFVIGEYTMCVFPWHAKQRGKISVHCMDMRVVLEGASFFSLSKPGGCSLNWECLLCDSANKLLKMWQWKKKKKVARPPVHKKNGGAQTNGVVSCTAWREGGIIQARQTKFRRQWKTNTVVCNMISNLPFALAM